MAICGRSDALLSLAWVKGLIRKRTGRLLGMAFCVALAVTLLASLGMFFSASKARMTRQAAAGVPVDWQVQLVQGQDQANTTKVIARTPGVARSAPVGYADVSYLKASTGGTVQTTGHGKVLGIPAGYASSFPGEIRFLIGSRQGVLLAQQTAANLQARPGDSITIGLPGGSTASLTVQGIVDLPQADSMFQTVGAASGSGPTAPPDNVVIVPLEQWHSLFDQPAETSPSSVSSQAHVKLSGNLPADPGAAFSEVTQQARNLEARLAGAVIIGDNLAAQLDAARSDAVYAQLLFLFLGLPCTILAALLVFMIAASGRARRRQEQALLRLRGARMRQTLKLAASEALLVGALGVAAGFGGAFLAGWLAFGTARFGATPMQSAAWIIASGLAGLAIAFASILLPAWHDARALTITTARENVIKESRPLWSRLYLDVILLAGAGIIFWQAMRNAYQVVVVPEGVPTISINYLTLLVPVMAWIGFALLIWRLSSLTLRSPRKSLSRVLEPIAGGLSGVVASSMSRQSRHLVRGLVIIALAVSFAISIAVFNTTYTNQARVDAQLTNGADVTVSATGSATLPADLPAAIGKTKGVVVAEPMQHRFAYVGNDLQDLYGIDPTKIARATAISNSFFSGGSANQILSGLASRPDGVLVAEETVKDFQLHPGDLIRIRLLNATDHEFHPVDFHYVGVAREFPTAPRDSFLVANASYVARATGSNGYETLLVRTSVSPHLVASRIRSALGPMSAATVKDVQAELRSTLSGLTAIDLSGLTRLELIFAIILAAAASGLVFVLGLSERRRTFAISSALGATTRQLSSFVWSEAAFITAGGVILGTLAGWTLSFLIVRLLTGVFDPPPEHLLVPWLYLGIVLLTIVVAVVAACMAIIRAARTSSIEIVRDL
jgi:putative ABC transport system permease protein